MSPAAWTLLGVVLGFLLGRMPSGPLPSPRRWLSGRRARILAQLCALGFHPLDVCELYNHSSRGAVWYCGECEREQVGPPYSSRRSRWYWRALQSRRRAAQWLAVLAWRVLPVRDAWVPL